MELESPYPKGCYLTVDRETASLEFTVDEGFLYFEGHFPGNPIVPAVTQVGWILAAVEAWTGEPLKGYRLSRFKFVLPLRPETRVKVVLERSGNRYSSRVFANESVCCSGNVSL